MILGHINTTFITTIETIMVGIQEIMCPNFKFSIDISKFKITSFNIYLGDFEMVIITSKHRITQNQFNIKL